jgi:RimJ/RimL family protein N-acetyltransferase
MDKPIEKAKMPEYKEFAGKYVTLKKIQDEDVEQLYPLAHGSDELELVWKYMLKGPFSTCEAMKSFYRSQIIAPDKLVFCVHNNETNKPIGVACFLAIDSDMASVEIGHLWYAKTSQHSEANTEVTHLLIKHCIEDLGFRRITWKCDNENTASKNAAMRLGFEFEGLFRNHMIVKGINRDTAWFGLIDKKWSIIAPNYEKWLSESNSKDRCSLLKLNGLVPKFSIVITLQDLN